MQHNPSSESLQQVFNDWSAALNEGRLDDFYAYFHADADILDEDFPWRMTKTDFIDHIGFHATSNGGQGVWEFFQWIPRELHVVVVGHTGHVAGFSTFRGKPRDCGFRQRFMGIRRRRLDPAVLAPERARRAHRRRIACMNAGTPKR